MKNRLGQCDRGATAIEFALLLPALLYLMLGSIEFSLYLLVQSAMEGATYAASRVGKTGFADEGQTREQSIRNEIDSRLGFFLDSDRIEITSLTYANFDSVARPEPYIDTNGNGQHDVTENYTDVNGNGRYDEDQGADGTGGGGEIVVYTVSYPWTIITPFMREFLGNSVDITSRFIVKNEPFDGA